MVQALPSQLLLAKEKGQRVKKIQQMKHHLPRDHVQYHHLLQPLGNTTRSGQKIFHGQNMMTTSKVHFSKYAERLKPGFSLHKEVEVCGSQSLSRIGKRQFKR